MAAELKLWGVTLFNALWEFGVLALEMIIFLLVFRQLAGYDPDTLIWIMFLCILMVLDKRGAVQKAY